MRIIAVTLMLALSWASSCGTKPETVAVRSLAASKGFIESEMSQHGECRPQNSPTGASTTVTGTSLQLCKLINDAIQSQHVAVAALDTYCSSTDYLTNQGPCSPPTATNLKADAQAKLTTAVSNLDGIIASIKSIAGGK